MLSALGAENVAVRVLNGNDLRPMKGHRIWLYWREAANSTPLERTTDDQGIARFVLPERPIQGISIIDTQGVHGCSRPGFLLSDVIKSGVVPDNLCDPKHKLIERVLPKPGEAVVFVKPIGRFEGQR